MSSKVVIEERTHEIDGETYTATLTYRVTKFNNPGQPDKKLLTDVECTCWFRYMSPEDDAPKPDKSKCPFVPQ